jgi:hypothetical protein
MDWESFTGVTVLVRDISKVVRDVLIQTKIKKWERVKGKWLRWCREGSKPTRCFMKGLFWFRRGSFSVDQKGVLRWEMSALSSVVFSKVVVLF